MTLEEAYVVLGVNEGDCIEEIKWMYESLVKYYAKQAHHDPSVKKQLALWKEAYEVILLNETITSLYAEQHKSNYHKCKQQMNKDTKEGNEKKKTFAFYIGRISLGFICCVLGLQVLANLTYALDELSWIKNNHSTVSGNESNRPLESVTDFDKGYQLGLYDGLDVLRNDFKLEISKLNESISWDWAYFENTEYDWYVIIPIKVKETKHAGALLSLYQFKLNEEYPTTVFNEDIYTDSDLKKVHFLGQYEELIPKGELFGIVFHVPAFSSLEERTLFYEHQNGDVVEVGKIRFNDIQNTKPDVNFNIVELFETAENSNSI